MAAISYPAETFSNSFAMANDRLNRWLDEKGDQAVRGIARLAGLREKKADFPFQKNQEKAPTQKKGFLTRALEKMELSLKNNLFPEKSTAPVAAKPVAKVQRISFNATQAYEKKMTERAIQGHAINRWNILRFRPGELNGLSGTVTQTVSAPKQQKQVKMNKRENQTPDAPRKPGMIASLFSSFAPAKPAKPATVERASLPAPDQLKTQVQQTTARLAERRLEEKELESKFVESRTGAVNVEINRVHHNRASLAHPQAQVTVIDSRGRDVTNAVEERKFTPGEGSRENNVVSISSGLSPAADRTSLHRKSQREAGSKAIVAKERVREPRQRVA